MDVLLSLGIIGGMTFFSILALFQVVNQRYPPKAIDVYDRGVKQRITYRTAGTTIVENNLFKLLLNDFNICGDIRMLEYDIVPGKILGILPGGLTRVYRAYRRHDYLFALQHRRNKKEVEELTKQPPVIEIDNTAGTGKVKAQFSRDGFLIPMSIKYANETLQEKEVANGKAICARYIESNKAINQFTDASNPIITTLLMALPLLLVVIANGVVIYLLISGVSDNVLHIAELQKQTVDALTGA